MLDHLPTRFQREIWLGKQRCGHLKFLFPVFLEKPLFSWAYVVHLLKKASGVQHQGWCHLVAATVVGTMFMPRRYDVVRCIS